MPRREQAATFAALAQASHRVSRTGVQSLVVQLARSVIPIAILALGGFALLVRLRTPEAEHECALASPRGAWCDACGAGTLASLRIESKVLFDALDAHGHQVDPRSIECATCSASVETGSYCEACRRGFVGGLAYLSRLAYEVARGRVLEPASLECATCRENATCIGWCQACMRGMVGRVEIADARAYALVAEAYRTAVEANEAAAKCELCAAARVTGGTCPRCRIDYAE
jgi:hypothetical protein